MTAQDILQEEFISKGVEFYKTNDIGWYNLAMRMGKCRISIELLKRLFDYDCTLIIAYPDNKLKTTWENECKLWGYNNPNITYVNFSSLFKYEDKLFDFIIIDEFHSLSDNEREIAQSMSNNNTLLLLSGTISDDTISLWNKAEEIAKYTTIEGIDAGILADYTISIHLVNLDNKVQTKDSKGRMRTEKQRYESYSWVIEKMIRERRDFMHLALARNRLSLSSIAKNEKTISLLKKLYDKRVLVFTGLSKVADDLGIPSYHSKSKNDEAFKAFQEGRINHLALAAMGKVGVTYPNLDSVILTNFTYNAEESSQILNRAIKLDYKDKIADLHILCLNEPPELKKIKESLSMLDITKIKYI